MKTHYGSIKFTTKERLEFPYIDDIVKRFNDSIKEYCKEYNISLVAVRISVNVVNQEFPPIDDLYTVYDYIKEDVKNEH